MTRMRCASIATASFLVLATGLGCQSSLNLCEITQQDCQQEIYSHMLSLRGDGYDPFGGMPPTTVITEAQYRQILLQQTPSVGPWDRALDLLHFTSPAPGSAPASGAGADAGNSYIDDEVANVAAYYSSASKSVVIVSHPSQTGEQAERNAMISLAHEFVHAMQDRELDLNASNFQSTDAYFAYDTLIEGDARFYELLFANDLLYLRYNQSNIVDILDNYLYNSYMDLNQYGSSLFAARALAYFLGARYEAVEYHSGGNAAIRHGYASEPQRTVGFLVGMDGVAPPVGSGNACPAPAASLAPSNTINGMDEFGALLFYAYLRGWGTNHDTALTTAQSWVGDSLRVQATNDLSTTAVAWHIELSAPPPAAIINDLTATGELTVTTTANGFTITVSDSQSPLTWTAVDNCP